MNIKNSLLLFCTVIVLSSCYPTESIPVSDLDLVVTLHEKSPDFSNYSTYSLLDVVGHDPDKEYDGWYNDDLLATVRTNMNALGYTEVDIDTDSPHLQIITEIILADNKIVGGGGCYYCWGTYPGYPGYYPPYYPPTYVVTFTTGTIVINISDTDAPQDDHIKAVWVGVVDGVVRSGITAGLLTGYVDQAFDQSPYLKIN